MEKFPKKHLCFVVTVEFELLHSLKDFEVIEVMYLKRLRFGQVLNLYKIFFFNNLLQCFSVKYVHNS